nr:IS3 family transposase [Georgenia soli]
MVLEHRQDYTSEYEAIRTIAERLGVGHETLRKWVRRAEVDAGARPGVTSAEATRIKELEKENRELRRANEILKSAGVFLRAGARPATAVICRFIDENRARFGVEPICRVLTEHGCKIAPSTYYAYRSRRPAARTVSDATVLHELRRLRLDAHGRPTPESLYGYRKTWHALRARGVTVARCTLERLMREHGMRGAVRSGKVRTTVPGKDGSRAGDRLNRDFTAAAPNLVWVADFTYVRTWAGFVYVAFAVDVFSQAVVGWHAMTTRHTDLVLTCLRMATWARSHQGHPVTTGLIHHSDAGSQYTSLRFTEHLDLEGIAPSIGSVGDAYDNALMESIVGLYKTECIKPDVFHAGPYRSIADVEYATMAWVEWYNTRRLHSALGYLTPTQHEANHYAKHDSVQPVGANN